MVGVPIVAQRVTNPTSIHEDVGLIPGLAQWIKYLVLLWLWCRPGAAAPIQPLAGEFPCAAGAAPPQKKKKKKEVVRDQHWETKNFVCKIIQ